MSSDFFYCFIISWTFSSHALGFPFLRVYIGRFCFSLFFGIVIYVHHLIFPFSFDLSQFFIPILSSLPSGLLSSTLPNGFGGPPGPEGERSLAPPDASILISNVCSIGDHVAQELFQGPELGTAEEAERPGEKAGQHSPLREEHVTCVQSKKS